MIRSIRPTDLGILLRFNSRVWENHARSRRNAGEPASKPLTLATFLEQWLSLDENRHSWIFLENRSVSGLVSVMQAGELPTWEVDCLFLLPEPQAGEVSEALLNYVSVVGGELGITKVFLKLLEGSPVVGVARRAGFFPYVDEQVYLLGRRAGPLSAEGVDEAFRAKTEADELGIFQLYSATVPSCIRQAEAMTFPEWRAVCNRGVARRLRREYVLDREGKVALWLQVTARGRRGELYLLFDLLEEELLSRAIDFGLGKLAWKETLLWFVPGYQAILMRLLEERGFVLSESRCCLVKQLAARVRQARLIPARA